MKKAFDVKEQYFMDDPREAGRLEKKVNGSEVVDKYLRKHIDDLQGAKVLEAGCGPGVFLRVLANLYPGFSITGVDISGHRIEQANLKLSGLKNAVAIQADIYKLPFPDDHFDFIYSRFLFEYLQYPVAAAKELYRVCKPGGKLLLQDLDSQFTFYPELGAQLKNMLQILKQRTGFDPDIGRKLFSVGKLAGFSFADIESEMYHKVMGQIDEFNLGLWNLKLDIALNGTSFISAEQAGKLKAEMLRSLLDENTVMFSNLFTLTYKKCRPGSAFVN